MECSGKDSGKGRKSAESFHRFLFSSFHRATSRLMELPVLSTEQIKRSEKNESTNVVVLKLLTMLLLPRFEMLQRQSYFERDGENLFTKKNKK